MTEPDFYIDSNVLLAVGQPQREYFYKQSLAFLDQHRGQLVIGPIVHAEVQFQLRERSGQYQAIADVKYWLYRECRLLPLESVQYLLANALAALYRHEGWDGEPGDKGDRLHAATASVAAVPFLVTWERRFIEQRRLINRINGEVGLPDEHSLRIFRPDPR